MVDPAERFVDEDFVVTTPTELTAEEMQAIIKDVALGSPTEDITPEGQLFRESIEEEAKRNPDLVLDVDSEVPPLEELE